MTEWVPRFDYPSGGEWLWLDVNLPDPDGAKQVARQIADRGGWRNRRYAKEVYQQLKNDWVRPQVARIEPVVVYVPHVRRNTLPLSPADVDVRLFTPDHERTLEATMAKAREPMNHPTASSAQEPEITAVELPAGPACRVHEVLETYSDFGDQVLTEYVDYTVLPEVYSKDMVLMRTFWTKDSVPGMVELADKIAATLTFVPRGSGEEWPRPVLDAPVHVEHNDGKRR
jgi:hypothetical protein